MEKTDEHLGSDYSLHRLQQKQACLSSAKENVIREDADSVGHMKLPLSVVLFPHFLVHSVGVIASIAGRRRWSLAL